METFDKKQMRKIPGYSGYYAYKNGRIYRKQIGGSEYRQISEYRLPYSRYLSVYVYKNKIKEGVHVHKLIASAFRKVNSNYYRIFHRDKNFLNNEPRNLVLRKLDTENKCGSNTYSTEIKDFEAILKNYINYDYNNPVWNEYKIIKLKRSERMIFNWLKVFLMSKKLI